MLPFARASGVARLMPSMRPARALSPLLPGGFGITPGRHHDRSATKVAGLGQAEADNARVLATSQEVRLELSGGVGSLPQVPRWNAVRRARCASARAAPAGAAVDYALGGVPPPFSAGSESKRVVSETKQLLALAPCAS